MISDSEVTDVIEAFINEGINTKMELVKATAKRANISRKHATKIIEKYSDTGTGNGSVSYLWAYEVRDRGAKVYNTLY